MSRSRYQQFPVILFILLALFATQAQLQAQQQSQLVEQHSESEDTDWSSKGDAYWKSNLSPHEYKVCRAGGTERAFSGKYDAFKKDGFFHCSSCGQKLFSSDTKFDSGTGWPSFYQPTTTDAVELRSDNSFFMRRTEVVCSRCGAHLGHVFDDGPRPTGKRYCINSVCLEHRGR